MKLHILPHLFISSLVLFSLAGCGVNQMITFSPSPSSPVKIATPTVSNSLTPTTSLTPTKIPPKIIVFYGDSSLAIGEIGDGKEHVGFSFVTNLKTMMDQTFTLITANFGGRTAKWAYEHLEENVFVFNPDIVTLWWGFDDMGGCPGTFDRETNRIIPNRVNAIINTHIENLASIIEELLEQNIPVFVLTPIPALQGLLPWSHLDNNNIVWEEDRWCDFNQGLGMLAQAQRDLVEGFSSGEKPVFLVDVWQVYVDHPETDKMYMDVVHPASTGAQLIAEEWLETYEASYP